MSEAATTNGTPNTAPSQEQAPTNDQKQESAVEVLGRILDAKGPEEGQKDDAQKTDEKKPAQEERLSPHIAQLKKAEKRAAQEREENRRARAENETARAEITREREAIAETKKIADAFAAAKGSPTRALEILGIDIKSFVEKYVEESQNPETAKVSREVDERLAVEAAERKKLEDRLKAYEDEKAQREQQARRAEVDRVVLEAQQAFLSYVSDDASKFPTVVDEFTPDEIAARGLEIAEEYAEAFEKKFGIPLSNEYVAQQLEREAIERKTKRTSWRGRKNDKSADKLRESNPSETNQSGQATQAQPPRTLTDSMASETGTSPPKWTQEWADAESVRILEKALSS